jgi:type I restriction enzyme S subunit
MMVFRIRSEHNPQFVMWLLNSPQVYTQAYQDVMGSTAPHINISTIRNFSLALPSRDEQDAAVAYIETATQGLVQTIEDARREIALLREYRIRLITDVITGKLDVRETAVKLSDEIDEPEAIDEEDALAEDASEEDLEAVPEEAEA